MVMPNRKTPAATPSTYRYGFNGKENDDEVYGDDNEQDYGMRIYDPRLGRFLSVDPIASDFPWYTPYQFAGNKPIWAIDLDGLEEYIKPAGMIDPSKGYKVVIAATKGYEKETAQWVAKYSNGLVFGENVIQEPPTGSIQFLVETIWVQGSQFGCCNTSHSWSTGLPSTKPVDPLPQRGFSPVSASQSRPLPTTPVIIPVVPRLPPTPTPPPPPPPPRPPHRIRETRPLRLSFGLSYSRINGSVIGVRSGDYSSLINSLNNPNTQVEYRISGGPKEWYRNGDTWDTRIPGGDGSTYNDLYNNTINYIKSVLQGRGISTDRLRFVRPTIPSGGGTIPGDSAIEIIER
jgi:RHS repeat-associated protein